MTNTHADAIPNFFQTVADFRADDKERRGAGIEALLRLAFGGGPAAARAATVLQDAFASLGLRLLGADGAPVAPPADTTDGADKADKGGGGGNRAAGRGIEPTSIAADFAPHDHVAL